MQQKAKVATTQEISIPMGKAPTATYTTKSGNQTVHGQMIAAPSDKSASVITVSTLDRDDTAEIAKTVTDSGKKSS